MENKLRRIYAELVDLFSAIPNLEAYSDEERDLLEELANSREKLEAFLSD